MYKPYDKPLFYKKYIDNMLLICLTHVEHMFYIIICIINVVNICWIYMYLILNICLMKYMLSITYLFKNFCGSLSKDFAPIKLLLSGGKIDNEENK